MGFVLIGVAGRGGRRERTGFLGSATSLELFERSRPRTRRLEGRPLVGRQRRAHHLDGGGELSFVLFAEGHDRLGDSERLYLRAMLSVCAREERRANLSFCLGPRLYLRPCTK